MTDAVFVGELAVAVDVALEIGPLQQDVVVTAEAGGVLQSQTGAPVTVIDSATLEALNKPDVLDALRLVPAPQIVQVGQRGGATSLFLRGGNSNFTKVLIDGMPANDIGGGFDFSQLDTAGVDRIEVLRQTNSVVYGSDALTGVVNITTRRGSSRVPEFQYSIDGGNLSTFKNSISLGGACGGSTTSRSTRTSRPTTTSRTTATTAAPSPAASASRLAAAPTSAARCDGSTDGSAARTDSMFPVADDSTQDSDLLYSHRGRRFADHRSLAEHHPLRSTARRRTT